MTKHTPVSAAAWQPLCDIVVDRLRTHLNVLLPLVREDDDASEDESATRVLAEALGIDRYAGRDPNGDAAQTTEPAPLRDDRPERRLPPLHLLMAIRLSATLRTVDGVRALREPGSIAIFRAPDVRDMERAYQVFKRSLFPIGTTIVRSVDHGAAAPNSVYLLRPENMDGEMSRHAVKKLWTRAEEALSTDYPMVMVIPAELDLPDHLLGLLPPPIDIAAMDREIVVQLLRHSHSSNAVIDENAVRAHLPNDRALARLSLPALLVALREPTAVLVAQKLAALCPDLPDAALPDIPGSGPAVDTARRLVSDLRGWSEGRIAWTDLSRSMLLSGPPGVGKTWLSFSMGRAAGMQIVTGNLAEWQAAGHLGDLLAAMRSTFAEARKQAPCILFIDEIDSAGSRDRSERHNLSYHTQVINGLLLELDSIARQEGVIVIGACNHLDMLDPAIVRSGRFDIKIQMDLPDADLLYRILQLHLGAAFPEDELREVARRSVGATAADVDAAIRAARSISRAENREITLADIVRELALDREYPDVLRRIALHECGHAIAAVTLGGSSVKRILIAPGGGETVREHMPMAGTKADYEAELVVQLAGRAAECLILGDASGGSGGGTGSDLASATVLALAIELRMGFGTNGPVWLDAEPSVALRDPDLRRHIQTKLETAQDRAREILAERRELLLGMAEALLNVRDLSGTALDDWMARVPQVAPA